MVVVLWIMFVFTLTFYCYFIFFIVLFSFRSNMLFFHWHFIFLLSLAVRPFLFIVVCLYFSVSANQIKQPIFFRVGNGEIRWCNNFPVFITFELFFVHCDSFSTHFCNMFSFLFFHFVDVVLCISTYDIVLFWFRSRKFMTGTI